MRRDRPPTQAREDQQQQQKLLQQRERQLEMQRHQQQQQQQRQPHEVISYEEMRRDRPPSQAREQVPPQQRDTQQRTRKAQHTSQFLKRKQKNNIILDEGEGDIPFSATREFFKYELFVTNLNSNAKIEDIKSHLVRLLCTEDIFIKPMSKLSAPYLSLGVFVKSESSDLNGTLRVGMHV